MYYDRVNPYGNSRCCRVPCLYDNVPFLVNEASSAEYLWCNTLYGEMTLNPDAVKEHATELIEALEYLAEDYQHPNGFNLINAINNKINVENARR